MENQSFTRTTPIYRSDGVNESERYLTKLSDHSFLPLWSYPSLTRDQGRKNKRGDGKELCDLLVVFGNDVIIFQDKECAFGNSGDLQFDWGRWYRAAIQEGAKQIWGAERWIKESPALIFLDRLCTQPFPFDFPDPSVARYHRIIVAHGASERCKQELGGSGSLRIQATGADRGELPFTTGQVNSCKGFVHILDDIALNLVLQTLDTIGDLVKYLFKKEAFVTSGQFYSAEGEEELLATYLTTADADQQHSFMFPKGSGPVKIGRGGWEAFSKHLFRLQQLEENKISYFWDEMIKSAIMSNLSLGAMPRPDFIGGLEVEAKFLATENRTSRRGLSELFLGVINTVSESPVVLVTTSPQQAEVCYILVGLPDCGDCSTEDFEIARRMLLRCYCVVSKLKFPKATHMIGIATELECILRSNYETTYHFCYYDATTFSDKDKAEALKTQKRLNLFRNAPISEYHIHEYPVMNGLLPIPPIGN